jgi:dolichyl-phosphate-mannose--protein O-mannosyl transferase
MTEQNSVRLNFRVHQWVLNDTKTTPFGTYFIELNKVLFFKNKELKQTLAILSQSYMSANTIILDSN